MGQEEHTPLSALPYTVVVASRTTADAKYSLLEEKLDVVPFSPREFEVLIAVTITCGCTTRDGACSLFRPYASTILPQRLKVVLALRYLALHDQTSHPALPVFDVVSGKRNEMLSALISTQNAAGCVSSAHLSDFLAFRVHVAESNFSSHPSPPVCVRTTTSYYYSVLYFPSASATT